MADELENLTGTVENITYRNDANGYAVTEVKTDENEFETVVGILGDIAVGEQIVFQGEWTMHPNFGRQFKSVRLTHTRPSDASGMHRFLASGIIKGIGEATATKIIEKFGSNTFNVIENEPERLAEIKGISRTKAKQINRDFKMQFSARDVMNGLSELGFNQQEAYDIYNVFKGDSLDIAKENPYALVSVVNSIDFARADEIAMNLDEEPPFDCRCQAGVTYIVRHNLYNGHTCLPRYSVIKPAMLLLECSEDEAEIAIDNAIDAKQLVEENINDKPFLFLPEIYEAESSIAQRIKVMIEYPPTPKEISPAEIDTFEKANDIVFDEKQRQAIEIAVNKGLLILTGGPGTGKTTTVKGIITLMENRGLDVALAAPTGGNWFLSPTIISLQESGKASSSAEKTVTSTIDNSSTITASHSSGFLRLCAKLGSSAPSLNSTSKSLCIVLASLPVSSVILLAALPVGAGNVLADLIKSNLIGVVSLDKIFRQAMKSKIVSNAHRVVNGEMPVFDNSPDSDFFLLRENSKYIASRKIVDLVTKRIPIGYGFDSVKDIQVLCPSRKGEVGTENINALLQAKLNPPSYEKNEVRYKGYTLREGDKVMQIKNNYDVPWFKDGENGTGVFNGDIGILTCIDKANDIINVKFDDKEAMYSFENVKEIELAYAMTVHKSQGSEFSAVVLPTVSTPPKLSYRNLFYTALTRARNLLIIVGNETSIKAMVDNDKKSRRYSALVHFLSVDNNDILK